MYESRVGCACIVGEVDSSVRSSCSIRTDDGCRDEVVRPTRTTTRATIREVYFFVARDDAREVIVRVVGIRDDVAEGIRDGGEEGSRVRERHRISICIL